MIAVDVWLSPRMDTAAFVFATLSCILVSQSRHRTIIVPSVRPVRLSVSRSVRHVRHVSQSVNPSVCQFVMILFETQYVLHH